MDVDVGKFVVRRLGNGEFLIDDDFYFFCRVGYEIFVQIRDGGIVELKMMVRVGFENND